MPKEFAVVSKEIVKNAINSAIYIDDEIAEPYIAENSQDPFFEIAKEIYISFSENNCCLIIRKFSIEIEHQLTNFERKDLLVLDWQLNSVDPKFVSTLEILRKAVYTESLPFIYIYTKVPEKDFNDIFLNINSFFSGFHRELVEKIKSDLIEAVENLGVDYNKFKQEVSSVFLHYILNENKRNIKEVKDLLETYDESFKKLIPFLVRKYNLNTYVDLFQIFGFIISNAYFSNNAKSDWYIDFDVSKKQLFINQTIILIGSKIDPKEIFERFTEAVIRLSNNFLTILCLELRNLIRISPAFIDKQLTLIDDTALFFHKQNIVPEDSFYEFLIDIWKNQIMYYLNRQSHDLSIYHAFDDYLKKNNVAERILSALKNPDEFVHKLKELNYHYNNLVGNRLLNSKIGFGDVFRLNFEKKSKEPLFLLCITAHCDCLYPKEKIKNQFFFVQGAKIGIDQGVYQGDEGFTSFIQYEGEIICIEWKNKPFTLYIDEDQNDVSKPIDIFYNNIKGTLDIQTTIKENYAQRIANHSFTYPLHVGIFFAKYKGVNP